MPIDDRRIENLLRAAELDEDESGTTIVRSQVLKEILTELRQHRIAAMPRKAEPRKEDELPDDICALCKTMRKDHDGPNRPRHMFKRMDHIDLETAIAVFSSSNTPLLDTPFLRGADVEWVVNDNAELGVKIGQRFFFLYKGKSIVYNQALEEAVDGYGPMKWRPVGKREFGETVKPTSEHLHHAKARDVEGRYVLPLYGETAPIENGGWRLMPLQPSDDTHLKDKHGK